VTVTGNVSVASGASLTMNPGAIVDGNIQSADAVGVDLEEAMVGGNVILTGTSGAVYLHEMTIGGHVQVSYSPSGSVDVIFNQVTGNVLVLSNTSTSNLPFAKSPVIADNTLGGNLVCTGNTPPPNDILYGAPFPNTAVNGIGQCAGLVAGGGGPPS
jgi:hypothetical protein